MLSLLAFLALLGVLICGHEFGHFLVAKLTGVKVEIFSIGFGKAIISKKIGETEYRIAWLPFGGYVRMAGSLMMDDEEQPVENEADIGRRLTDKSPLVRIAIAAAGPVVNLILPLVILFSMFFFGSQHDTILSNEIGAVDEGMPAYVGGLREGDRVVEIAGKPVEAFWQLFDIVDRYDPEMGALPFTVERPNEGRVVVNITPAQLGETDTYLGFTRQPYRIGYQPMYLAGDIALAKKGMLAQAGLQNFDRVISVNGIQTPRYVDVLMALKNANQNEMLQIEVLRGNAIREDMPFLMAAHRLKFEISPGFESLDLEIMQAGRCVSSVAPEEQNILPGDCLLAVDGDAHSLGLLLQNQLLHEPERAKQVTLIRDGERQVVSVQPINVQWTDALSGEISRYYLGFSFFAASHAASSISEVKNEHRFAFALDQSTRQLKYLLEQSIRSITGMFTGQVSPTQLSGPVTIFYLAGEVAAAGFDAFLRLMVVLSLSIALLNLVPIPGLDGGQILVAFIEGVMRRPLPERARMALQLLGVVLVLGLIIFALGNDAMRLWRVHQMGF